MEIEGVNGKLTKIEKKELLIFLLVAFGIPFLIGIQLAIIHMAGIAIKDTIVFAAAQMFCPAAGFMLAKLICDKDKSLLPKNVFGGFLLLTLAMLMLCFIIFFMPSQTTLPGYSLLILIGSIVVGFLYFVENEEKLCAYGLKSKNWKMSMQLLFLFIILYFSKAIIYAAFTGEMTEILGNFSLAKLMTALSILPLAFILSFPLFLGEEYGWRCYFQPLLQKKFGLIKGVLIFGSLWGLWHMLLDLFYFSSIDLVDYTPTTIIQIILCRQVSCISGGIFMAYAYMRTNNLWLPVLLHFFNNNLAPLVVSDQELRSTWGTLGLWALVNFTLFVPFLFSKVFRNQVPTQDNLTQI